MPKFAAGPLIGYARVSTQGQDLAQQRATLREAGCTRIFEEKISGAKRDRPELGRLLDHLRAGDVVTVTLLDRLRAAQGVPSRGDVVAFLIQRATEAENALTQA